MYPVLANDLAKGAGEDWVTLPVPINSRTRQVLANGGTLANARDVTDQQGLVAPVRQQRGPQQQQQQQQQQPPPPAPGAPGTAAAGGGPESGTQGQSNGQAEFDFSGN